MSERLMRTALALTPAWVVVWWASLNYRTAGAPLRILVVLAAMWSILCIHALWRRR